MNAVVKPGPVQSVQEIAAASVVDLFCGAGGLSHGFLLEDFPIACGIDVDERCRYPFETNNRAPFIRWDVSSLDPAAVTAEFTPGSPRILVGCAPCQPFSRYSQGRDDPKWQLLQDFARIIVAVGPDVVSMENVPRLLHFRGGEVFDTFVAALRKADYHVSWSEVFCPDYGVPQQRTRLVLLASRLGPLRIEPPTHEGAHRTVAQAIGDLPAIAAGETHCDDRLHVASGLSSRNLERMTAAVPGGTWRDWADDLVVECHRKESGRGYSSVYGRMRADEPAPTITTQFYGFGSGRVGHPDQHRALSLREGAILQSFPPDYAFVPVGAKVQIKTLGRLIGNAVPVLLARAVARSIRKHLCEHGV